MEEGLLWDIDGNHQGRRLEAAEEETPIKRLAVRVVDRCLAEASHKLREVKAAEEFDSLRSSGRTQEAEYAHEREIRPSCALPSRDIYRDI